jgi:hypothetical protein
MEELAKEYAEHARFYFVYVRESHPGEDYASHTSYEQKLRHAKDFRDIGLKRPMLIDTLDGEVHRAYSGLSNMTWIIDRTGRVFYKASWTDAGDIRRALDELVGMEELKKQGRGNTVFYREIAGLRSGRIDRDPSSSVYMGGKEAKEEMRLYRETHSRGGD